MSDRLTDEQLREQAMRMDIINKGGNPDHVLGQKLGGSDDLLALRARVAKLEAALTAAQQLIRDLGSPQAADRLGSEFGLTK